MLSQVLRSLGLATSAVLTTVATPVWSQQPLPPGPPPEPASVVCTQTRGTMNCTTSWASGSGMPLVVYMAPPDGQREREVAERVRAWEDYCKPALRYDHYGVGRYVYQVAGCEFGRSQD